MNTAPRCCARSRTEPRAAFTIVELLVVVSIIALLVSILLPAVGKATEVARVSQSASNLRNLSVGAYRYMGDWNDHQFTVIHDNIAAYGTTPTAAFTAFAAQTGVPHPPIYAGWGRTEAGVWVHWVLESPGLSRFQPIDFSTDGGSGGERFGSFRLINVEIMHEYVTGKFYDPIYYAPKDEVVITVARDGFEHIDPVHYQGYGNIEWPSYCFSPAAMFHPSVMRNEKDGGWQDPWSIKAGFRSPSAAQALHPALKTHLQEHHWLQNRPPSTCNPAFEPGTYDGCEPWYFNHGEESAPLTVFYDGHTGSIGVRQAQRADGRMRAQTGGVYGLWSRDTFWGEDGYYISAGYDQAATSFHVFTTDGIRGRDIMSE
jgi:type II secretory pathway pseudopilin PulG